MNKKNIHIASFQGSSLPFFPLLWSSAKTYYEKYGTNVNKYNWVLPYYPSNISTKLQNTVEKIKQTILDNPPDFFGVSLYVWNYELSMEICHWVKEMWPQCIVVTGGPHQYFKHENDWFIKYPFIDASLPSEVYGELAITDILDNWDHDTNIVNWLQVEQIVFPIENRKKYIKSPKSIHKRNFKWDYSPYKEQLPHIFRYMDLYFKHNSDIKSFFWNIETTRGCPYACTYCDWGGGIMSKVIVKDLKYVKADIDIITRFNFPINLVIDDANLGINGDRDVEIVKYVAEKKKTNLKRQIYLNHGGFAKTNKHFDVLKEILTIMAENKLNSAYKIGVQTTDTETLNNIKRTDLRKEEHWELSDWLQEKYNFETVVEIIVGLPGMTLDKWYDEFNECFDRNSRLSAYDWYLLPESEAYSEEYRAKFGIETAKVMSIDSTWSIPAEVVIKTNSYSSTDYLKMWLAYALYLLIWNKRIYVQTIKDLLNRNNLKFGQFLKKMLEEVYPIFKNTDIVTYENFEKYLGDAEYFNKRFTMLSNANLVTTFFTKEYMKNFTILDPILSNWLLEQNADPNLLKKEQDSLFLNLQDKNF